MKKSILNFIALAMLSLSIISCSNENKETASTSATDVVKVDGLEVDVPMKTTKTEIPTFSSDDVNKGLAEFNTLKDEYIVALKEKNATAIQQLSTKYATWAQGAAIWGNKLKADEIQKYSEYMKKITQEWAEAAQNSM